MGRDRRVARGALAVLREVVGRVARAGAQETQRAVDARRPGPWPSRSRVRASGDPRPHRRPRRRQAGGNRAHDLRRGGQADQDGPSRSGAGRLNVSRRGDRGPHARRRGRPDGREPGRRRQGGVHGPGAHRGRRRHLAVQLPLQPRRPQGRSGAGRRVRRRAWPASQTPLSALLLAELEAEAGLPPGWLNVLVGRASEIGTSSSRTSACASSASPARPRWAGSFRERAARKKVLLELGNATR